MSEHIIETEEFAGAAFVPVGGADKLREEIVRCRDCKHYTPQGAITFLDYSKNEAFCSYIRAYKLQIGPDGFCAWGERRESE